MQVPCPSCRHPLTLGPGIRIGETSQVAETISGVNCPNCGFVPLESIPDEEAPPDDRIDRTLTYHTQLNYAEDRQVSHFALVRLLGQGGFGTVWLADDVNLARQVALKLPVSRSRDLSSLLHEAQAAAHLRHPNIVSIYEVGTEEGQVFIASEYIEGMTLKDLLTTGKPSIRRTVDLMISIASALEHAHSHGVVHRDVKPANILLNAAGQPFVTDFGLAKRISTESVETTISSEGQILGTARYMSPEQASGKTKETDHRADVYALGVILFEMLTGHVPFRGNMRAVLHQKIFEDSASPRSLDPSLPKDMETICLKCLERDPDKRYSSAGEVVAELRRFRDGEPILARPVSSFERMWRWCRRRPVIAVLLISLFSTLTIGLAGVTFYSIKATRNAALLRESLYRAQMTLAAEYVAHGDIEALRHTLDDVSSDPEALDLRGFEWYYYNAFAAPFVQVVDHGDHVTDVAVSADGKRLASTGQDRQTCVWNAVDGRLLRTLTLDTGRFRSIAFSPTTNHLATGSSDGFVRIWNPEGDGEPLQKIAHGPPVAIVRFSPDGKMLLSAGNAGAVKLWNVQRETLITEILAGKSGTLDIRFSPDGSTFAIATADGRIRLRNIESGEVVRTLEPMPNVEAIALSDDGSTLVTAHYNGSLQVWSLPEGVLRYTHDTSFGLIGDLEFLKDSMILALVSTSGELTLYDTVAQRVVRRVSSLYLTDGTLARSADGRYLAIGSGEGSVKLIETARIAQPDVCWHEAHIRGVEFLDDERLLAASGDGDVRLWNVASARGETLIDAGSSSLTLMTAHAGRNLVAIATAEPAVKVYDVGSLAPIDTPALPAEGIAALRFSPRGEHLAIAQRQGLITVVNCNSRSAAPAWELTLDSPPTALAYSPDGETLIVATEDGALSAVDARGNISAAASFHVEDVPRALEVCPANGVLAIGTDAGTIHLWDLAAHALRATIKAHTSRINVLRVLPNGSTLVSGGRDRELRLWDTSAAEQLTALDAHMRQVFCIAVAPHGETLASGDLEGAVHLWRAPRDR